MQHKQLIFCTILLLGFGLTRLRAQEVVLTTGGNALGFGGSMSYSVGQIACQTQGKVVEGVQQPYEISVITVWKGVSEINLMVLAYPNPATDNLLLQIKNDKLKDLSYELYDIQGKFLQNGEITANITSISIGKLPSTTYFVTIMQNNRKVKIFKIIKN